MLELLVNLGKVAIILSIIPVTSCSAERSFSVLQKLKTNHRSTKDKDCPSDMALLCIKRFYSNRIDTEEVIEKMVPSSFSKQFLFILNLATKQD